MRTEDDINLFDVSLADLEIKENNTSDDFKKDVPLSQIQGLELIDHIEKMGKIMIEPIENLNKNQNSILNEEYTEKIKEMNMYIRNALEIYNNLPDIIKSMDKKGLRAYLGNSVDLSNEFAKTFNIIDTK